MIRSVRRLGAAAVALPLHAALGSLAPEEGFRAEFRTVDLI